MLTAVWSESTVSQTLSYYHTMVLFIVRHECHETQDPLQSASGRFPLQPSTGLDHLATNIHSLLAVH